MRYRPLTILLTCYLALMMSPLLADTLGVGEKFPNIRMLYAPNADATRIATFQEVARDKSIVFIFASW